MPIPEKWIILPREHRKRWTQITQFKYQTEGLHDGFVHLIGIYKNESITFEPPVSWKRTKWEELITDKL